MKCSTMLSVTNKANTHTSIMLNSRLGLQTPKPTGRGPRARSLPKAAPKASTGGGCSGCSGDGTTARQPADGEQSADAPTGWVRLVGEGGWRAVAGAGPRAMCKAVQSCTRAAAEGHMEWQREGGGVHASASARTCARRTCVRAVRTRRAACTIARHRRV